jgi:Bromodomain
VLLTLQAAKSSQRPTSLTAMRDRVKSHHYKTVDDFGEDLVHLLDNVPSTSTVLREKASRCKDVEEYAAPLGDCFIEL